jgi:ubiquinol-cytochrome c reductase cytochrome b subunit
MGALNKLRSWLAERVGQPLDQAVERSPDRSPDRSPGRSLGESLRDSASVSIVPGGASFAHTLGTSLLVLLALQALTGLALSFYYSPSATDAWASVAYLEDQVTWGGLVRGLHLHGASALVIGCALHLTVAAWLGAYRRPRELTWLLGLLLLLLVLGFSVTGFVLRWDQAGYWASKVEVGIAGATPLIGGAIQKLAQGGNDYGNLTLTRFHALHVVVLPALTAAIAVAHRWLARRHGVTPRPSATRRAELRAAWWPEQTVRNLAVAAAAMAALFAYSISVGGAGLDAPADPTAAYEARPLWYFRWLFHLRKLAGSFEALAALAAPAVVLGFFAVMPWLDPGGASSPPAGDSPNAAPPGDALARRRRLLTLGGFAAICAAIALLTFASLRKDAADPELAKHAAESDKLAAKARRLARTYGVPAAGGTAVYQTVPMWRGRSLWEAQCASCHQGEERKGPLIEAGYGGRAWIARFLADPSGDEFFGRTELGKGEAAMKPVELTGEPLAAIVELVYAESGAADADPARVETARAIFEETCSDCHSREDGVSSSGPALARRGTVDHLVHFIGNPKAPIHYGDSSEMPRFDRELSVSDREALARYLVWLRTATADDVAALEPL